MDERELAFVNEATVTARPLEVVPTFASVAAGFAEPGKFNLNSIALDGERDITFHSTLPPAPHITADSSVIAVYDKGKDKGTVIRFQTMLKASHGAPLATLMTSYFAVGTAVLAARPIVSPSHPTCRVELPIGSSTFARAPIRG